MSSQTNKNINYLSKDFDSIREDLIQYLQRYFPNTWQDFNNASGGMALLELMAFMGDSLNFQIDRQVNETFLNRAVERKNILSLAENVGYKVKPMVPAQVNLTLSANFLNSVSSETLFTLVKGSRLVSAAEPANFEIIEDVDFSLEKNRKTTQLGAYTTYSVSGVKAIAGRTKNFKYNVGNTTTQFLKISLPETSVTEIISVEDSDGNIYYQVDNLARDTIFYGDKNVTSTSGDVEYVLKMKKVPNRYVLERESNNKVSLRFGSGTTDLNSSEIVPNPEDYVLPATLRGSASGFSPGYLDSTSFLKTNSLGNIPNNTTLNINYRVGGGIDTNIGANLLNNFVEKRIKFNNDNATNLYEEETRRISSSLLANNPESAYGGESSETNMSIKENAINFVNSQARCVTLQDYKSRIMSMPSNFGSVFRAIARKDKSRNSGIEIIIASRDSQGYIVKSPDILKNNIETYIRNFRSITDTTRFSDVNIVNIGVNFSILPIDGVNNNEALVKAIYKIIEFFDIRKTDFGITISKSQLMKDILNLPDVASVPFLKIVNITNNFNNREYSPYSYDIASNTKNDIIYFNNSSIPELKYPNFDIQGSIA